MLPIQHQRKRTMKKSKTFVFVFFVIVFISSLILLSMSSKIRANPISGKHAGYAIGDDTLKMQSANKAARVIIITNRFEQEIEGSQAPEGWRFVVLETRWENIHPKQKIEKDKLEGKTDRTMGVKTFARKEEKKKEDFVEVDVAYMIEKIINHAYLVADGLGFSLNGVTEDIPDGANLEETFTLSKYGEIRSVNFAYLIPERIENLGFRFFDYEYGHIDIPIRGDMKKALGTDGLLGDVISRTKNDAVEVAVHSFNLQEDYDDEEAPEDWRYAIIHLSGKSFLGNKVRDIIQIEPEEYTWVTAEGGYFYYCEGGSTTEEGMIRFTPEVFQHQELAFLIPASDQLSQLGLRIRNDVLMLDLTEKKPKSLPKPLASHQDGDIMEVRFYGVQKKNGQVIVDLGIQSFETSGIEIQRDAQFMIVIDDEKISLDDSLTDELLHRPPTPFIIPPKTFVRFELAFETDASPTSLYYRGYESENFFSLIKDD